MNVHRVLCIRTDELNFAKMYSATLNIQYSSIAVATVTTLDGSELILDHGQWDILDISIIDAPFEGELIDVVSLRREKYQHEYL